MFVLAYSISEFFATLVQTAFPNTFLAAFILSAIIALLLVKIHSPMSFTLMISFAAFAIIAGFTNSLLSIDVSPVSAAFSPVFLLLGIIGGLVLAYAIYRALSS